jgi:hypothetical protein
MRGVAQTRGWRGKAFGAVSAEAAFDPVDAWEEGALEEVTHPGFLFEAMFSAGMDRRGRSQPGVLDSQCRAIQPIASRSALTASVERSLTGTPTTSAMPPRAQFRHRTWRSTKQRQSTSASLVLPPASSPRGEADRMESGC